MPKAEDLFATSIPVIIVLSNRIVQQGIGTQVIYISPGPEFSYPAWHYQEGKDLHAIFM